MTKSKMRIYKGNGYSDHTAKLDYMKDFSDNDELYISSVFGEVRLPADDVILALWPRILEHIEEVLDED